MELNILPHKSMTFAENHHGKFILDELHEQRKNSKFCDVLLDVNNKTKYPAHRCVLSACSPYFASLLIANKVARERVGVETENEEDMLTILDYMYTGTIIMNTNNVGEILKLADAFLMLTLKDHCSEYLQHYLDISNCLTVWEMANRYGLESLKISSTSYISTHLSEVLDGEEILKITKLRIDKFLRNSSCQKWKISDDKLFDLITSWVYQDPMKREGSFRSLLTWISWQKISPDIVVDRVQGHSLFSVSPKCLEIIIDVLKENCLLNQPEYHPLSDLKDNGNEQMFIEEDNDSFINLAITAAINDPNVEKYAIETGKEFIKLDFKSQNIKNRDTSHREESKVIKKQNTYILPYIKKEFMTDFEIENYHKDNYIKNNDIEMADHNFFLEQEAYSTRDYETFNYSHDGSRSICHQYKEFTETDNRTLTGRIKCPNFTNKAEFFNHKQDLNHKSDEDKHDLNHRDDVSRTNELSLNQIHFHKNISGTSELNSPPYTFDLNKESSCNYFEESLNIPLNSIHQDQNGSLLLQSDHKRSHFLNNEDLYDVRNDFQSSSLLLTGRNSLNTCDNMRENTMVSTFHQNFANFEGSCDTQSSNNYPKDMSLPHLRLSEHIDHFQAENGLGEVEKDTRDLNKYISVTENVCENIVNQRTPLQSRDIDCNDGKIIHAGVGKIITKEVSANQDAPESPKESDIKSMATTEEEIPKEKRALQSKQSNKRRKGKQKLEEKAENNEPKKKDLKNPKNEVTAVVKTCDVCSKTFGRKKDYFSHMMKHFPGPDFTCESCSAKFKRIYYLLDHRQIHLNEKPFKCSQCSFSSRREFNLKEHMSLHSATEKPFKCEECGDSFDRKQSLAIHMTKHSNERPFICETCGWSAKTRNSLVVHLKIHSGKLYTCHYRDCPYRTPKKSHLKEHMQFHTKSRPFSCEVCGLRFISKTHLRRHSHKHETPNMYQCYYCDHCTSRLDSLKIHIKRKHTATKPKVRLRTGQLKKKDALLSNKKCDMLLTVNQRENPNLYSSSERISPNPAFAPLPESFSHYQPPPSSPSIGFVTAVDPDDPTLMVSEIEDTDVSYLSSNISQALSGFLDDPSCGDDRFVINSSDVLYYS